MRRASKAVLMAAVAVDEARLGSEPARVVRARASLPPNRYERNPPSDPRDRSPELAPKIGDRAAGVAIERDDDGPAVVELDRIGAAALAQRNLAGVRIFPALRRAADKGSKAVGWVSGERIVPLARHLAQDASTVIEHLDKFRVVDGRHAPAAARCPMAQERVN